MFGLEAESPLQLEDDMGLEVELLLMVIEMPWQLMVDEFPLNLNNRLIKAISKIKICNLSFLIVLC